MRANNEIKKKRRVLLKLSIGILIFLLCVIDIRSRLHYETTSPSSSLRYDTALPHTSAALGQVLFVSCNRHDRSQHYWQYVAAAAQCEAAPLALRSAATRCTALYSGQPSTTEGTSCGEVLHYPLSSLSSSPLAPRDRHHSLRGVPPLDGMAWMGDAIYADKPIETEGHRSSLQLGHTENSLPVVKGMWTTQRDSKGYTHFRETCVAPRPDLTIEEEEEILKSRKNEQQRGNFFDKCTAPDYLSVYGTWDDHDMGINDGGKEYKDKETTQKFLLNFLGAPRKDPRWNRPGVYTFHTIPFKKMDDTQKSEFFSEAERKVFQVAEAVYENAFCFILLDVRSFRDRPNATFAGDVLGEAQWRWLEDLLAQQVTAVDPQTHRHTCAMTLIASGTQFMMDVIPSENWSEFPKARDRLLATLRRYGAERVAFLTGDIHMGELGVDFTETALRILGFPLVEATSSGLTHSAGDFGAVAELVPHLFHTPRRLALYMHKNFGMSRLIIGKQTHGAVSLYERYLKNDPNATLTAAQVAEMKTKVDEAVEVGFTIFSIGRHGQPIMRLQFPLEMLSYEQGLTYRDAFVSEAGTVGVVKKRQVDEMSEPTAEPEKQTYKDARGNLQEMFHYPLSPLPRITRLVRFMQYAWFRDRSIPMSLVSTIKMILKVTVITFVVYLLWWWKTRRSRRRRLSSGSLNNSFNASGSGANFTVPQQIAAIVDEIPVRIFSPAKVKKI
ncbi:PhoD-like phosphatase, putative [Angomonas deanei]|uniref:PhoD-like phosphatase, putative n=1 Tax=Angomonas deanei TaxID=59799 RepID=A0A7G2CSJ8_9TRYP|nr:PhoD-like phosphatase, putative [Angomonas deanei]